jgi:translation initiation factor IF-2
MALNIFNTLSRAKEEFKPISENKVGLYTCGPTVYNYPHIGNYRAYIFGDIKSAVSGKGIVLGFNTRVANSAAKLADHDKVLIRTYNVIYELIDEMKDVVEGMLKIDQLDEVFGTATILAEFPFGKTDRIAGCRVLDGTIAKGPKVRVVRGRINGDTGEVEGEVEVIGEGKIRSLKKGREEVPSISKGGECGIMFDTEIDWHVGDIVQTYRIL